MHDNICMKAKANPDKQSEIISIGMDFKIKFKLAETIQEIDI